MCGSSTFRPRCYYYLKKTCAVFWVVILPWNNKETLQQANIFDLETKLIFQSPVFHFHKLRGGRVNPPKHNTKHRIFEGFWRGYPRTVLKESFVGKKTQFQKNSPISWKAQPRCADPNLVGVVPSSSLPIGFRYHQLLPSNSLEPFRSGAPAMATRWL